MERSVATFRSAVNERAAATAPRLPRRSSRVAVPVAVMDVRVVRMGVDQPIVDVRVRVRLRRRVVRVVRVLVVPIMDVPV